MNRLSWFANRIRGLEPRSATPDASSIVLAKADGTIDRGWTPSVAWTDSATVTAVIAEIHQVQLVATCRG